MFSAFMRLGVFLFRLLQANKYTTVDTIIKWRLP